MQFLWLWSAKFFRHDEINHLFKIYIDYLLQLRTSTLPGRFSSIFTQDVQTMLSVGKIVCAHAFLHAVSASDRVGSEDAKAPAETKESAEASNFEALLNNAELEEAYYQWQAALDAMVPLSKNPFGGPPARVFLWKDELVIKSSCFVNSEYVDPVSVASPGSSTI